MAVNTILLVEDNDLDAELTMAALKSANLGNNIVRVKDGEEAIDYLFCTGAYKNRDDGPPAVAVLDIKMPKLSGIEVLEKIRESEALKLLPTVILTSSNDESDINSGYENGVNAYVVKPIEHADFKSVVFHLGKFWGLINEQPMRI